MDDESLHSVPILIRATQLLNHPLLRQSTPENPVSEQSSTCEAVFNTSIPQAHYPEDPIQYVDSPVADRPCSVLYYSELKSIWSWLRSGDTRWVGDRRFDGSGTKMVPACSGVDEGLLGTRDGEPHCPVSTQRWLRSSRGDRRIWMFEWMSTARKGISGSSTAICRMAGKWMIRDSSARQRLERFCHLANWLCLSYYIRKTY